MKLNVMSLVGAGLLLAAGCICFYFKEQVTGAALVGAALGLFGTPPLQLKPQDVESTK